MVSCRKDKFEDKNREFGKEFVNNRVGSSITYNVMEIQFDEIFQKNDTSYYQLKEFFESEFIDNKGNVAQRIERHKRATDTSNWVALGVYYQVVTESAIERVEENIRFLKLTFPVAEDNFWNYNSLNNLPKRYYFYEKIRQNYKTGSYNFDVTTTVTTEPELDIFTDFYHEEIYAKGIGLVFKNYTNIEINPQKLKRGFKYIYTLKEYDE